MPSLAGADYSVFEDIFATSFPRLVSRTRRISCTDKKLIDISVSQNTLAQEFMSVFSSSFFFGRHPNESHKMVHRTIRRPCLSDVHHAASPIPIRVRAISFVFVFVCLPYVACDYSSMLFYSYTVRMLRV